MRTLPGVSILCGLLAGQGLAGIQGSILAQESGSFRVDVRLVQVDAQVMDKKTHQAIGGLKRDDLQVYEDGVPQQISTFSQDELPMSIVLLFDLTDSVRPVLKPLAAGALEALQHLRPEDEVAVMVYSSTATLLQEATTDRRLTAAAIEKASRMESGEAAFFNEGIFQATAQLRKNTDPNIRRVIIWLTDDVPNIPSEEVRSKVGRSISSAVLHTEKQTMAEVLRAGVVVCTLLKRSEISDQEDANRSTQRVVGKMIFPPGDVYKYAQASGGQVIESSGKKMKARLAEMIDDLRKRYALSYHPSTQKPKGTFCSIQVKLAPEIRKTEKDLVVEAKQGYYR